jgi:hypothetical protein
MRTPGNRSYTTLCETAVHVFAYIPLLCYLSAMGTVAQQPIAVKPYFSLSLPVRLWFGH